MGEPELDFSAVGEMAIEQLKKLLAGHPEQIEELAQRLLKERSTPFLPRVAGKVIRCLTQEEDFHLPKVAAFFTILQLNHFLGLDPGELLQNAILDGNIPLAHEL